MLGYSSDEVVDMASVVKYVNSQIINKDHEDYYDVKKYLQMTEDLLLGLLAEGRV